MSRSYRPPRFSVLFSSSEEAHREHQSVYQGTELMGTMGKSKPSWMFYKDLCQYRPKPEHIWFCVYEL